MAKLTISFSTVTLLFFLFTFSSAHLQVFPTDNAVTKPDTDAAPTILLPSEKSEFSDAEIEAVDVSDLVHLPLPAEPTTTFVKFRPINRHFRVHGQFPLWNMRRRAPCRHFVESDSPRAHEISPDNDMLPSNPRSREISYGNDMILSSENRFDHHPEELFRDQVMPSMTLRFQGEGGRHHHHHHHLNHDKFMTKYEFAKEKLKRPFRREVEEEKEKKHEEGENGGFVKRFRKFLHHF